MHRSTTRLAARLAALLLPLLVLTGLASPAGAGGPTSVLIVDHDSGAVTGLYYSDDDYTRLGALLGEPAGSGTAATAAQETQRWSGRFVTVTWLIHDVSVWRVDQVFPDAADGPWIYTTLTGQDGTLSSAGSWHRPSAPAGLVDLLDGLLTASASTRAATGAAATVTAVTTATDTVTVTAPPAAAVAAGPTSDPRGEPRPSPVAQAVPTTGSSGPAPAVLLVVGLVSGLVVGLVLARWTTRRG